MLIDGIAQINAFGQRLKAIKEKEKTSMPSPVEKATDTYEASQSDPAERAKLLQSIKDKIRSGFYNSDEVAEDLSHSFARALDQTL